MTYFLWIGITCSSGILLTYLRAKKMHRSLSVTMDLCLLLMVLGFLGARLMHIAYEAPMAYFADPLQIFRFWQGGFVYFGGAIAAILGAFIYLRNLNQSFAIWADFFAPIGAFTYGVGRVSCWLTGCCYGKWISIGDLRYRFPTQAMAVILELLIFFYLLRFEKKRMNYSRHSIARKPGFEFALWLCLHCLARMLMETFRADDRGPQISIFGSAPIFSVSMLMAFTVLLSALFWISISDWRRHKAKP